MDLSTLRFCCYSRLFPTSSHMIMTSSRGRRNLIVARHEEIFFISKGTRLRLRACIPSGWTKSKDLVMDGIDLAALGRRTSRNSCRTWYSVWRTSTRSQRCYSAVEKLQNKVMSPENTFIKVKDAGDACQTRAETLVN